MPPIVPPLLVLVALIHLLPVVGIHRRAKTPLRYPAVEMGSRDTA